MHPQSVRLLNKFNISIHVSIRVAIRQVDPTEGIVSSFRYRVKKTVRIELRAATRNVY